MNLQSLLITFTLSCVFLGAHACILSLDTMESLESTVTDFSVEREYILCPNNVFDVGTLDYDNVVQNGTEMIHARPNLVVKCGDDGVRENSCVIRGGSVHVDGTPFFGVASNLTVQNVKIAGLTFEGAAKHSVWITKPGSVLFQDCEFREHTEALSTVMVDYSSADGSDELIVTFDHTDFVSNAHSAPPAEPTLVVGNGMNNRLQFENCEFTNNTMVSDSYISKSTSSLVETSGPLAIKNSCFKDNTVGPAPILSYNPELTLSGNFQSNSGGSICPLSGQFLTASELDGNNPTCTSADATSCQSQNTFKPTMSPNSQPSPTDAPKQQQQGEGGGQPAGGGNSQPTESSTSGTANLDESSGSTMVGGTVLMMFGSIAVLLVL